MNPSGFSFETEGDNLAASSRWVNSGFHFAGGDIAWAGLAVPVLAAHARRT